MPWTYKSSKDNTVITDIPDNLTVDSPEFDAKLAEARAKKTKQLSFGPSQSAHAAPADSDAPSKEELAASQGGLTQADTGAVAPYKFQASDLIPKPGDLGAVARGVVQGAASPVTMVADPVTRLLNHIMPANLKSLPPSEGLSVLLTKLGLPPPQAQSESQKILQAATAGLAGGESQYLVGKVMAKTGGLGATVSESLVGPGNPGARTLDVPRLAQEGQGAIANTGKLLSAQPVQQMVAGGAAGAASQGAGDAAAALGAPPLVQAGVGLAAGVAAGIPFALGSRPANFNLLDDAERAKVPIKTSDVFPPKTPIAKWARNNLGDRIPVVGTGGGRAVQQEARVQAVKDIVDQYSAGDINPILDDVAADMLKKNRSSLEKWNGDKLEVLERLSDTTPGPFKVPSREVAMDATAAKIDGQIAYLKSLKSDKYAPVISKLEDWKKATQGQTLRNIETLRKDMGKVFDAPELIEVKDTGKKVLKSIYPSVNEDMGAYIKRVGSDEDYTKWRVANTELAKGMQELELPALKRAIQSSKLSPEDVGRMIFSAKPSDMRALYRNLTPAGQQSARAAVIARAAEKAGETASPEKFVNELNRLKNEVGVFFTDDNLDQVKGLAKVINATRHAGEAVAMPATGVQAVVPMVPAILASAFGGGWQGFAGGAAASAALGSISSIYESPTVRNILINLGRVKEGSQSSSALLAALATAIETAQNPSGARISGVH